MLRAWEAIRPNDPSSREPFFNFLDRLAHEDPMGMDKAVHAAARCLKVLDYQAALRRDVMARAGHLEGLVHNGNVAVRSDAFVLPMAGDYAAMHALALHPGAVMRLLEGLSQSERFAPSDVVLIEAPLPPAAANSAALAFHLARTLGWAVLSNPEGAQASPPEEAALRQRLDPHRVDERGLGPAVLVGVRVWHGAPENAPDEGDLLLAPDDARARRRQETEWAWQSVVVEALALAELPPGSMTVLPPATFLRGLAQARALEQIHGLHQRLNEVGGAREGVQIGTHAQPNGRLACEARDRHGRLLAQGPSVELAEIHPEGQAYLATFAHECDPRGPKTQRCLRRRGLH